VLFVAALGAGLLPAFGLIGHGQRERDVKQQRLQLELPSFDYQNCWGYAVQRDFMRFNIVEHNKR